MLKKNKGYAFSFQKGDPEYYKLKYNYIFLKKELIRELRNFNLDKAIRSNFYKSFNNQTTLVLSQVMIINAKLKNI